MPETGGEIDSAAYAAANFITSAIRRMNERLGMDAAVSDAEAMVLALSAIITNERGLVRLRAIFDGALHAAESASEERAQAARDKFRVVASDE